MASDIDASTPSHATSLTSQEVRDLKTLSDNVVDVLTLHALDSGMPPKSDIARKPTLRDEPVYDARPPRRSYVNLARQTSWSGSGRPSSRNGDREREGEARAANPSTGDTSVWDAWGGDTSTVGSTREQQRTPAPSRQQSPSRRSPSSSNFLRRSGRFDVVEAAGRDIPASNASTWSSGGRASMSTSSASNTIILGNGQPVINGWGSEPSGSVPALDPKQTLATSAKAVKEDDWASYTHKQTINDAYERRMALSRSGGSSVHPSSTLSLARQSTVASQSTTEQHVKPSADQPNDDGWGNWQASTTANDAYERRARMNGDRAAYARSTMSTERSAASDITGSRHLDQPGRRAESTSYKTEPSDPSAPTYANDTEAIRPVKAESADDGWGIWSASTQVNDAFERRARMAVGEPQHNSTQPVASQTRRQSPPIPSHTSASAAKATEQVQASQPKKEEEDGWGDWQATSQVNDAFERRAKLRPGETLPATSHQRSSSTVSNGWANSSQTAAQGQQNGTGHTDSMQSPYASTPYQTADLLSRLTISSPAPASRQTLLPELNRQKKGISIKGNFQRLMAETTRREATGENSRELAGLRKRVSAVEAVQARSASSVSGRSSVAPSEYGRTPSPAVSTGTVHAPQPVRPVSVQNNWSGAENPSSYGNVYNIREPQGPASEGSLLGKNFKIGRIEKMHVSEVPPLERSETPRAQGTVGWH